MRLTPEELRNKALLALEDAVQECRYRVPRRSFAIRFALAYLWASSRCSREPFDEFWNALRCSETWRLSSADTALLRIYRSVGVERPSEVSMKLWLRWEKEQGHGGKRGPV